MARHEKKLLIVDDDPAACRSVTLIARALGFDTRSSVEAEEFFRLLKDWSPTHLVIDLVMPEVDGVDVLHRLAQMRVPAHVIITSGQSARVGEAARQLAMELGLSVQGVLCKPFVHRQLQELLQTSDENNPPAAEQAGEPLDIPTAEIAAAIERREFAAYFQPKVDCSNGVVTGFEALARWHHPDLGIIAPESFIMQAEQGGLINALSAQVAEQALLWFARNFASSGLELALNLSGRTVSDPGQADSLSQLCQRLGVPLHRVVLEVTETYAMADPLAALALLTRFRIRGFQLAIDDFGIGYSSLAQLARLPFSELKVDRSFVNNVRSSQVSQKIVTALVKLGHSLGLRVAAEGVEDRPTLLFLRDLGCHQVQGYFIGRPMAPDETKVWLQGHRADALIRDGR